MKVKIERIIRQKCPCAGKKIICLSRSLVARRAPPSAYGTIIEDINTNTTCEILNITSSAIFISELQKFVNSTD